MSNQPENRVEYPQFLAKIEEINEKIHQANLKAAKQETEQTIHTLQLGIDIKRILEEIKEIRKEHNAAITLIDAKFEKFEEDKIEPLRKDITDLQNSRNAVLIGYKTIGKSVSWFWFILCGIAYFVIHSIDYIYNFIHKL